jgi:hypothetical protein
MYPMSDFITAKMFTSLNKKIIVCYEMSGDKKRFLGTLNRKNLLNFYHKWACEVP